MNLANCEHIALLAELPTKFRWPGEVDLRKWELKEVAPKELPDHYQENNAKVLETLQSGLALTASSIGHHTALDPATVGWALKRLFHAGAVVKATRSGKLWRLA